MCLCHIDGRTDMMNLCQIQSCAIQQNKFDSALNKYAVNIMLYVYKTYLMSLDENHFIFLFSWQRL